jgi:hypothetical protein
VVSRAVGSPESLEIRSPLRSGKGSAKARDIVPDVPEVNAASSEAKDPFRGRGSDTTRLVERAGRPMLEEISSRNRCRKSVFLISPKVFLFGMNIAAVAGPRFGASLRVKVRVLVVDVVVSIRLWAVSCSTDVPLAGISKGEGGPRGSTW